MFLIDPKEVVINYEDEELKFKISKFPATVGREIITKYPVANMPKIGDYAVSQETMLKLMQYVVRVYPDREQELTNEALINNHVPSWEVLGQLEVKMIEYNCSFFKNGKAYDFLKKSVSLAQPKIIEILMALSDKLSQAEKQPSKN